MALPKKRRFIVEITASAELKPVVKISEIKPRPKSTVTNPHVIKKMIQLCGRAQCEALHPELVALYDRARGRGEL